MTVPNHKQLVIARRHSTQKEWEIFKELSGLQVRLQFLTSAARRVKDIDPRKYDLRIADTLQEIDAIKQEFK